MGDLARILDKFSNDDVYKLFLTDDFDVKVVTSAAVQLVAVSEHLAKLSAGILALDNELHNQVVHHYKDLLFQATEIETLEIVLQKVHCRIQSVLTSAKRLRRNVVEPYEAVSSQTIMLARLQMTCDLLRRIIRIMLLCRRLEIQLHGSIVEITKAAQSINELDYLTDGVDLDGISIIESDLLFIKRSKEQIHTQANTLLLKGIESRSGVDVATALQVFYNLQILTPMVHQVLQQIEDKISLTVQEALDVKRLCFQPQDPTQKIYGPGRAAIPLAGNSAAFRAKLWANMEGLMKHICCAFNQVVHLHSVLTKRRDSSTHVCFFDELNMGEVRNVIQNLWQAVTKILTEQFSHAAEESSFIKQEFEVEFPKLLCMFNDLVKTLQEQGICFSGSDCESSAKEYLVILSDNEMGNLTDKCPQDFLRKALAPFESAYLSRCLSRLTDSVNVVYAGEGKDIPTVSDIEGIINAIKSELTAASIDPLLLTNVAKNVAETITFVVGKCQYLVCTDENAAQVIDVPNASQLLNAQVVHLLHLLQTQLDEVLQHYNYTSEAKLAIQNSLQSALSLMNITVEPLLLAVSSAIKAIIITMHKEDFSVQTMESNAKIPESPCSLYMKELQHFITRSQNDYFSLYPDCSVVIKGIQNLASHAIEMFVCHASLVRPLGDGGKMRLAADCAQMEMAVSPFCQRVGDLGKSYRLLRSFRPLLFQTANHIVQSTAVGDIVPYSIALHLLFSRAPPELQSPHMVANWSIDEYSRWLENHPLEKQRLVLIKGTLEKYITWIKQRQGKEFCAVYPVILNLLLKGLKSIL